MALAIRERREYNGCEIVIERENGSRITGLAHANPIWDEAGTLIGAVNIVVDITERKRMEDALRAADRQKDQFLAMLAHELRNPLAPIINATHILGLRMGEDPIVQRQREAIERNARHLSRLVEDLLEVSRINEGKIELRKERVDLARLVQQAVDSIQPQLEERQHSLSVSLPLEPVYLDADPVRLVQILVNLLDNAVKYTDRGGQITVMASHHNEAAVLSVRDTGRGIEPDQLSRIFELFVQGDRALARSEGGLGVGLTLVSRLVELHGGSIGVQSGGPGQGAEFTVRLPAEPARPTWRTQRHRSASDARERTPVRRVLLVEDNIDAAETLAELLALWGHEVRVVHDGVMALDTVSEYQPEVVLLDIGLPGKDGFTVAAELRATQPPLKVALIALTGYGDADHSRRGREAGFDHYVTKPVVPERLRELLAFLPVN